MADVPETDGKNLVELLDMLKPIPEPEPISMLPATPAWIWLGLACLALLGWLGWKAKQRRDANAYRRAALAELEAAGDDPAAIAAIIRRAAMVAYPRQEVAGLVGDAWLGFLDEAYGGNGFSTDLGAEMARAPYRPQSPKPDLTRLARTWLKSHKAPGQARSEALS